MRCRVEDDEPVEMQMAPLIDCVFLLLIFFLVATTLKKIEPELPLTLPESVAAVDASASDVVLQIGLDAGGQAYLDGQPVTLSVLHERLRRVAQESPDRRLRLDVDQATTAQSIIHVLDLCQFEGLRNVGLHTRKR